MELDEESRSIEQKKIEFCIVFWIGVFLIPVSICFWGFYIEKMDTMNNDSFAMMRSPETVNSQVTASNDEITTYTFFIENTIMTQQTLNYTRPSNYLFISLIHTLLFIRRSEQSTNEIAMQNTRNFPVGTVQTDILNIIFNQNGGANSTGTFPIKLSETYPINDDNNAMATKYLTRVDLILFRSLGDSLGIGNTYYQEMSTRPTSYEVYVRDSETMKEPYTFPSLEQTGYAPISLITLFIALVFVVVFLWHWWSVKYIVIEIYIRKHIKNNKWY